MLSYSWVVNAWLFGGLDQVSIDGNIYALPVNNAMYGIYYNMTLIGGIQLDSSN